MSGTHRRRLHRDGCRCATPSRSARGWPRHPEPHSTSSSCCPADDRSVITPPDAGLRPLPAASRPRTWLARRRERCRMPCPCARTCASRESFAEGLRRGGRRARRLAHRRRRRERRPARPPSARHRRRPSCCTRRTCPSCWRPRVRDGSIRDAGSPASRRPSARGPAPTRCWRRAIALATADRRRAAPACRSCRSTCRRASTPASSASPARRTPTTCSRRRSRALPDEHRGRCRGRATATASKTRSSQLQLGAGRDRRRRLEPTRAAPTALPRLDGREDAPRAAGADDRRPAHHATKKKGAGAMSGQHRAPEVPPSPRSRRADSRRRA